MKKVQFLRYTVTLKQFYAIFTVTLKHFHLTYTVTLKQTPIFVSESH